MCICDTPLKGVMTHRLRTRALEVTVMCKKKKKNSQNEDFSPPPPASSLIFKLKGDLRIFLESKKSKTNHTLRGEKISILPFLLPPACW